VNDGYAAASWPDAPAEAASYCRSIVLHELVHCLTRRQLFAGLERTSPANAVAFAREMAAMDADPESFGPMPPATMHGPRFTRAAVHLWHRAGGWASDLQPRLVNGGYQRARYSGLKQYLAALGDELDRFRGLSIAELRALPLPPTFLALWKRDAAFTGRVGRYD
jgi:hypothetical protein